MCNKSLAIYFKERKRFEWLRLNVAETSSRAFRGQEDREIMTSRTLLRAPRSIAGKTAGRVGHRQCLLTYRSLSIDGRDDQVRHGEQTILYLDARPLASSIKLQIALSIKISARLSHSVPGFALCPRHLLLLDGLSLPAAHQPVRTGC